MSIQRCFNIADFRKRARARLPGPLFHYIDGGADDEWTLRNNTGAFDKYALMPTQLRDVSKIGMGASLLGRDIAIPLLLAPTGMSRLFHHEKEIAVVRAAAHFGIPYALSTLGTASIEEIAAASPGAKIFQIYILKDRELTREFVGRVRKAGYTALCLTVDTPLAGNRERDLRTGMAMPPRFGVKSLVDFALHPHWMMHFLLSPHFTLANVAHRVDALGPGAMSVIDYLNSQLDRSVSWADLRWLIELWGGPFIVKGLQSPHDACLARDAGASAVMISNHGGRQLESAPAPVDCVAPMRAAVGDAMELIVDGGVRRGVHVLKALALGANAVSFGRPYLYALAAGGEAGVMRMLTLFRDEIERGLALLGCASIKDIEPRHIVRI